jgi:hypothetical protein
MERDITTFENARRHRIEAETRLGRLLLILGTLTRRHLLAHIPGEYERRGNALRCLDKQGKIAWKASPQFLMMLADAERDAEDELDDRV